MGSYPSLKGLKQFARIIETMLYETLESLIGLNVCLSLAYLTSFLVLPFIFYTHFFKISFFFLSHFFMVQIYFSIFSAENYINRYQTCNIL